MLKSYPNRVKTLVTYQSWCTHLGRLQIRSFAEDTRQMSTSIRTGDGQVVDGEGSHCEKSGWKLFGWLVKADLS